MNDPNYNDIISFHALKECAKECITGVDWKASVQMFYVQLLAWLGLIRIQLIKHKYKTLGFHTFRILERGKPRLIQAVHVSERVVQKSLCNNALKPIIEPLLIDTNTASRKGMGTQKALDDIVRHLEQHVKKHGRKGGILIMDLHDYFHSIDHEILLQQYRKVIKDDGIFNLIKYFVKCFKKGLGLGSEISQISAIFYANDIDHYVKDTLGIDEYARYMDDSYVICEDIDKLREIRRTIENMYADLKIEMNTKKTQIVPFEKSDFIFLKKRFHIEPSGRIVVRPLRKVITTMRRKLVKFKKKLDNGDMNMEGIRMSYRSWRGTIAKYDTSKTIYEMDKQYLKLFDETWEGKTVEDIIFLKSLPVLKKKLDEGTYSGAEIMDDYMAFKMRNAMQNGKDGIIKEANLLIQKTFGVQWNRLDTLYRKEAA